MGKNDVPVVYIIGYRFSFVGKFFLLGKKCASPKLKPVWLICQGVKLAIWNTMQCGTTTIYTFSFFWHWLYPHVSGWQKRRLALVQTDRHKHTYTQIHANIHTQRRTHTIGRPHSMPRTSTYVQHAVKGSSHKFAVIKNGGWWSSCHRASQTLINLIVSPPAG